MRCMRPCNSACLKPCINGACGITPNLLHRALFMQMFCTSQYVPPYCTSQYVPPYWTYSMREPACLQPCADAQGFFYNRFPPPAKSASADLGTETDVNLGQELWYHVLGTPQAKDVLVLANPDQPEWQFSAEITDDGR